MNCNNSPCASKNCVTTCGGEVNINLPVISLALVGNPNGGKTTLFNALTGASQKVGNWPGVTVEKKSGYAHINQQRFKVIDLPGVYSLSAATAAVDERITAEFLLAHHADIIINVIDASNLERHLYLTLQLLELGIPMIVALNMVDVANARGITINCEDLASLLGCPVLSLEASQGYGISELKNILAQRQFNPPQPQINYFADLNGAIQSISATLQINQPRLSALLQPMASQTWLAIRLLENDTYVEQLMDASLIAAVTAEKKKLALNYTEDLDLLVADARYSSIQTILAKVVTHNLHKKTSWTARIDKIVLHRYLGIPIFLLVMYSLFFFAINIGGALQDFFDISSETIFVDGFAELLKNLHMPTWLVALLANGVGKGINTTITFIPVIGALFLFLALLEDSGYMARAAFVIDRFMRILGLPGKAFVPMIVGFGCNVPAVMAARTLENKRDRILTIMMSPFMSCGARLAIYAVFTAAFFPQGGQNIVFALYLIGILMAIATGFILRHSLLRGEPAPLIMELPVYHWPKFRSISLHAWQRLKGFVYRAGKLIVPICLFIGALNTLNLDGSLNTGDGSTHSILSWLGQLLTPVFAPMGIAQNNWPATVGLLTGVLAKEVVIGTLNTLYTQVGHLTITHIDHFNFWASMQEALASIYSNLRDLGGAFSNPVVAQAPIHTMEQSVYGVMYQRFDGKAGAFAYLLFLLLYFPCISTTAAMLRELHRGWSVFSIFWMTYVAYAVAVIFYQAATWAAHPWGSSLWIAGLSSIFIGIIFVMRRIGTPARSKS